MLYDTANLVDFRLMEYIMDLVSVHAVLVRTLTVNSISMAIAHWA